jgi:uncharacterized coiled-coil protein SlyX
MIELDTEIEKRMKEYYRRLAFQKKMWELLEQ